MPVCGACYDTVRPGEMSIIVSNTLYHLECYYILRGHALVGRCPTCGEIVVAMRDIEIVAFPYHVPCHDFAFNARITPKNGNGKRGRK